MHWEARPVLLVDDDPDVRDALGETLREEGFEVVTAQNGREAMRWLRERRPASCVIVLDLMMPIMDGNEFLREKRTDAALAALPVVVVSASRGGLKVETAPDVRVCLSKPIDMDRLLLALQLDA
jgi:CheY-like chemotaxis protein